MRTPGSDRRTESGLYRRDAHSGAILDAALDAVITIDHEGTVLEFNRAAETTFGYSRAEVLGRELAELIIPSDLREAHRAALSRWTADGPTADAGRLLGRRLDLRAMRRDGTEFPAEVAISRVDLPGPPLFTACIRDITERKVAEEALQGAEARYRTLVEHLPLTVYIDAADEVSSNIYTSPQVESMLGYSVEEWRSDPLLFVRLLHPDDRERVLSAHERSHVTGEPLELEYRLIARDGRVVWLRDEARMIEDPNSGSLVLQGFLLDVTARKEAEQELLHQAFHDPLTGLANRALFADRVEHALVLRGPAGGSAAVLFLDLDDFKSINDRLGHPVGDQLLQAVGERLRGALSASHTVARLGGDEFAILVEELSHPAAAAAIADGLGRALRAPFVVAGREIFATASIGIGIGSEAEELLRSADVAMYRAKAAGKAQYSFYAPGMDNALLGRLELVADLRRARVHQDFLLTFQPVLDLWTRRVVGVEALVRWRHPTRGVLEPAAFVPQAEETGLIVEIGRWVIAEACRQTARWRAELPADLGVSVNVSGRQLQDMGLVDDVAAALAESGLEPDALTLEITESVLAQSRDVARRVLDEVKALGVRLALDDFGTGFSSLSVLQDLPVDVLKVDRSFVEALESAPERAAIVRGIVEIGRALKLAVVAEGIKSRAQVLALKQVGCRAGQGFYFAQPLDAAALGAFVRANLAGEDSPVSAA